MMQAWVAHQYVQINVYGTAKNMLFIFYHTLILINFKQNYAWQFVASTKILNVPHVHKKIFEILVESHIFDSQDYFTRHVIYCQEHKMKLTASSARSSK